jgi:hypothetical protein
MQLKMRGLPGKTAPRPDNGVLMPVESNHDNATNWYEKVQLTSKLKPLCVFSSVVLTSTLSIAAHLEQRSAADFNPIDSRSLDLKYGAKLLLPTTCYT